MMGLFKKRWDVLSGINGSLTIQAKSRKYIGEEIRLRVCLRMWHTIDF